MSRKLIGIEDAGGFTAKLGVGDYLPLPILGAFPDPLTGYTLLLIDGDGNLQLKLANGTLKNLSSPKISNQYPGVDSGSGGVDGRFAASRLVAGGSFDPSSLSFAAGTPVTEDLDALAQMTAPGTGKKVLVLQVRTGQTAVPLEIQSQSGARLAAILPNGGAVLAEVQSPDKEISGNGQNLLVRAGNGFGNNKLGGPLDLRDGLGTGASGGGGIVFKVSAVGASGSDLNPYTDAGSIAFDDAATNDVIFSFLGDFSASGAVSGLFVRSESVTLTPGATVDLDAALGDFFELTPDQNTTITASNITAGRTVTLTIITNGTTSRTITFGSGIRSAGTLSTGTVDGKRFVVTLSADSSLNLNEAGRTSAL